MWTEALSPRSILRAALPERAFLRRDRGDALMVTNAPVFDPAICEIPGFTLQKQGSLMRIFPDEGWVSRWEDAYPAPPDDFCSTLLRFRGQKTNAENLVLFTHGLKLADAGDALSEAELTAFERALRQRAALALRGGCPGGIYASAVLLNRINHLYKGEKQP